LNKTLSPLVRPLGPRDHLRYSELAVIEACLASFGDDVLPSSEELLAALGDHANDITLAEKNEDGSFTYTHFGERLTASSGFDLTGRSTAEFDTDTRRHVEDSFCQALDHGEPLCSIMTTGQGHHIHSWQRLIFPVDLDIGRRLMTMVKPLATGLDTIHGRSPHLATCVIPLRICPDDTCFKIISMEPLETYLGACDFSSIVSFVETVKVPEEECPLGTLHGTSTMELGADIGTTKSIIVDLVHGIMTPFLVVLDVTNAARTSEHLRTKTHLLHSTCKQGKLGSFMISDRSHKYVAMAPQLCEILGVETDRSGRCEIDPVRARYDDTLREAIGPASEACWDLGEDYQLEGQYHHPEGRVIDLRITGTAVRDEAGTVISVFGLTQDITFEQVAKRQMMASEERFRDYAASAGDWCWETDCDHRIVDITDGLNDVEQNIMIKYVGKTGREIPIVQDDPSVLAQHFDDLEARREFKDFTYRLRGPDGELVTFQIAGKPRFDESGTFLGYRGIGRDITDKVKAEQEHHENQLALKNAQSIAGLGHCILDLLTGGTRWSPGLLRLVLPRSDIDAMAGSSLVSDGPAIRSVLFRVHRADRKMLIDTLRRAAEGEHVTALDVRYFNQAGVSPTHLRVMLRKEHSKKDGHPQLMAVVQDVTDLKGIQAELEKRTETLCEAQAMGGIGDWQVDLKSGEIRWSQHMYTILGLDPEQFKLTPTMISDLCPPEDSARIRAEYKAAISGKQSSRIDVQARRGDGTFGYYTMITKPLYDTYGKVCGLFGTVQDITERKHAERQLRSLAYFDPLTGLANRTLFTRELNDAMQTVCHRGGSAALLLLDLDHFKEVNDTLGHAAGDELLVKVARTLKNHVDENGFVARLGGDEFAIIVRDYPGVAALENFAAGIVTKLTGVLKLERGEVVTGTSLGIALIPQDGGTAEEALRNADLALYMAKDDGRGHALFFKPEMSRSVQARLNLARDLRRAIDENGLETRYQGQVDLRSSKVAGFETLVRWKHPIRGYISPAEFIPVAESSSLICDIGLWVLRDACKTGRAWLDAGEPERMISVNVSAAQIWQTDFAADALQILEETGYPPHLLCLELTESVFADHGEGLARGALVLLKEAGIRLALDDFGTGYSSLGYLNELPFDELKIDRCFIAGAHHAPDKARLLQGIIALGRGLGMKVIGEGAEEDGEIALLRNYGCDLVQGFAFMRPETAEEALRCAEQVEFMLAEALGMQSYALKKTG
jgi:diguanylate cyclase (GGDEF)-like protein/PAS domain S-box-containing protein